MELVSVAAVAENGVIGSEGGIPWDSLPEDRKQYRERVADSPVILGRVTFESMQEDLPGTAQVVLSRSERDYGVDTAYHASGVEEAIAVVESLGTDRAYVLGGADIYDLFQPHVDRMALSRVPGEHEGDAYFPEWDPEEWTQVETAEFEGFTLEEWVREAA